MLERSVLSNGYLAVCVRRLGHLAGNTYTPHATLDLIERSYLRD